MTGGYPLHAAVNGMGSSSGEAPVTGIDIWIELVCTVAIGPRVSTRPSYSDATIEQGRSVAP